MVSDESHTTLADKAVQLIQQLKRNPDILPPYADNLMRDCTNGIKELYQKCQQDFLAVRSGAASEESLQMNMYRHEAIKYVIRCCTAYTHERATRIKSFRWKYGGVLPTSIKSSLCEAEIEFFNEYCSALAEFQVGIGENGIDLMRCTHPPNTLFMQVRVLENYGEFETSDGNLVMLNKDSVHSLPRQDCEMLIKQGILERSS